MVIHISSLLYLNTTLASVNSNEIIINFLGLRIVEVVIVLLCFELIPCCVTTLIQDFISVDMR